MQERNNQDEHGQPLSKAMVLQTLRAYFEDKPLKAAYLFGSTARDEHTISSDIDLYLSFSDSFRATIFDLGRIYAELYELTGKEVDIVLAGSEFDFLKEQIQAEKISVYG